MKPFDQGWRDRLRGLPPQAKFEKAKTLRRVQYERGRHIASLWLFWVEANERSEPGQGEQAKGTIHSARRISFETAFKLMPDTLQRAVYAEEAFCSTTGELLVGLHL